MTINNSSDLERKSSAVTLSDMEIFIFPELMYALVLADIMSPRIWRWRADPWFAGIDKMKPYRRVNRLKQYIMDHYAFNLDLDTWGLTTKDRELERFRDFISADILKQSNALFGYEGDKYYFDIDIRTYFGLDKYAGNAIPYWKTETVEAMDAFRHKPNYQTGAGECVSLAALYAAALFVVARIPLKDIYLLATPLHSQNFIDNGDGILTNNRRLVTKNMWFNGTALSAQARRALENERVTIVAHESGYVHAVYADATIDAGVYSRFAQKLRNFLTTRLSDDILGNFLRHSRELQICFQLRWSICGVTRHIPLERVFAYEHSSPYRVTGTMRDKLMAGIDREEFQVGPLPDRIVLNDLEEFVRNNDIDIGRPEDVTRLKGQFATACLHVETVLESLRQFCCVEPQLPDYGAKRRVAGQEPLGIKVEMDREEIINRLEHVRKNNSVADMAFYAYRDLNRTEPEPFLLAAIQRNPVSIQDSRELADSAIVDKINNMPEQSIYDAPGRLAQPDEVWNYGRGDGVEKAILLANILRDRMPTEEMTAQVSPQAARLKVGAQEYVFPSRKELKNQVWKI